MYKFHPDGTLPQNGEVFVFGSNMAGIHGAGAARIAEQQFGAIRHIGVGYMASAIFDNCHSFAIPTKDRGIRTLPLTVIKQNIEDFCIWAKKNPNYEFFITRIGCGLAGYSNEDIAPLFKGAPANCSFPEQWKPWLS